MGYGTYREIVGFGISFPYPDKKKFVFSRNHTNNENFPVEFIDSDIGTFINKLKKGLGKDIWLVGGGQINGLFLDADLIDEMIVSIVPAVLGAGIPLFSHSTGSKRFRISQCRNFDHTLVQITYIRR
ncbi:MAG: dihydrofolate reductase [Cyclobacteriaceae bacterium]|nr:dihydrofolate reductase [Cyclobacteriaceae bacterium]